MSFTNIHTLIDVGVKVTDDEPLLCYILSLFEFPINILLVFTCSDKLSSPDAQEYWVSEFESKFIPEMKAIVRYTTFSEYKFNVDNLPSPLGEYVQGNIINEVRY